jgi:hypothetical protein
LIAHTGPLDTSASTRIERNFQIMNGRPSSPMRSWR